MIKSAVHPQADESALTDDLRQLKEEHPEGLFRSRIRLPHGQGEIVLIWRMPTYADAEALIARSNTDPIAANGNLAQSLAVGPSKAAAQELGRYPLALARWVDREVNPFFGGGSTTESEAL